MSFALKRSGRLLAVGLLAGLLAGLIAGGVGSRVAMRIVALAAGHDHYGELTDAEATVGEISAGGTVFLLLAGAFLGMFGGLGYVAVRRLLPGSTLVKGLVFGLLLLVIAGSLVIDRDNPDFTRLTSPYLAVGLFAALFVMFGVLVAVFVARFAGSAMARLRRSVSLSGQAALGGITVYSLVLDVQALSAIF